MRDLAHTVYDVLGLDERVSPPQRGNWLKAKAFTPVPRPAEAVSTTDDRVWMRRRSHPRWRKVEGPAGPGVARWK